MDPAELGIGRLFYAIRDAVVVGEVRTDQIVLWNPAAADLFGYAEEEIVGRSIATLVAPAFRDRHRAGLARYRDLGVGPIVDGGPVELLAVHRDGQEIPIELTLGRIHEVDDGSRYVLAVIRDRREARAAEAQRTALEREQAERRISAQFFQMAAHEIRTPLTTILGHVQLAARRLERSDVAAARANLEAATRGITDLADLVDELMDVEHIQTGRLEVHPSVVDLARIAREVAAGRAAAERRIEVDAPATALVHADERWIGQMLNNLIRNAVKYSPDGSRVDVTVQVDGARVAVRVRDKGLGIPADEQEQLFRPFFRARNVVEIPGTGLGLFISRRVAELHGGSLVLEASGPEGSTFLLTLPGAA
jgi:PAS domain S-box-containing protein